MLLTDEEIQIIADHIIHTIEQLCERYIKYGSYLELDDYVLTNVATDLQYRFNRYQIQEAFEDRRIRLLIDFFLTDQDFKNNNIIH